MNSAEKAPASASASDQPKFASGPPSPDGEAVSGS